MRSQPPERCKNMQINVEKLSPVLCELQIEVPAEKVSAEVKTAYNNLRKTARVRGFRQGKAPVHLLRQLYGQAVRADVAKRLMDNSLQQALQRKEIQPLTSPSLEPVKLKTKEPFSFKARFEVRPEIETVDWKGLEAARGAVEPTTEQVDAEIEKLRLEHATMQPVERAAKDGDFIQVKIHFDHGDDGHDESHEVELGTQQLLPFLEEALVGIKTGETKKVANEFPDNHPNDQLRGAKVEFELTAEEVRERILPEVDDEFAKDVEHDSLDALRKQLSEKVAKRLEQEAEEQLARQLVGQLCEKNPVEVPPSLVEQQARMSQQELQMLAQMGQQVNMNADQLRADSEMKVRAGLLMAEIAKENELQVTAEDLEKGYSELAEQAGKNVARIKAEYADKQRRDMLVGMILEDKVLDVMQQHAKISDA